MTPDPYRNAYQKALEDLTVISNRFEQLSNRKKHVENLVLALQRIFSPAQHDSRESAPIAEMPSPQIAPEMSAETNADEAEHRFSFLDVPAPLPESDGDPFERRVKANFRFKGLAAQRSF